MRRVPSSTPGACRGSRSGLICLVLIGLLPIGCTPSGTPAPADGGQGKEETSSPGPEMRTHDAVRQILATAKHLDGVPFSEVVDAATGKTILPVDLQRSPDAEIVAFLGRTMDGVLDRMNRPDSPVRGLKRINEASRYFEDAMREALNQSDGFTCGIPTTAAGAAQRSGYPDLRLVHVASGSVVYIDPKLFESGNRNSSLRTFYFEPKTTTGKILEDAHHILVGIEHDGNDGAWRFLDWHAVDLSRFRVRLKAEFQSNNRELYRPESIISSGAKRPPM